VGPPKVGSPVKTPKGHVRITMGNKGRKITQQIPLPCCLKEVAIPGEKKELLGRTRGEGYRQCSFSWGDLSEIDKGFLFGVARRLPIRSEIQKKDGNNRVVLE